MYYHQDKKLASKKDYLKALHWFRGGTRQDNIDCYNYWKSVKGGWRMLNAYLDRYWEWKENEQ